jgi:hypothetical protein
MDYNPARLPFFFCTHPRAPPHFVSLSAYQRCHRQHPSPFDKKEPRPSFPKLDEAIERNPSHEEQSIVT